MNTHRLIDWEEDEFNFGLLAIASHLEDYQLAFLLNKTFGTSFFNNETSMVFKTKSSLLEFSSFESVETSYTPRVYLIDNLSFQNRIDEHKPSFFKNDSLYQSYLIPVLKKWQYLLFSEDYDWLECQSRIKKPAAIIYLQPIDKKSLNHKAIRILTSVFHDK